MNSKTQRFIKADSETVYQAFLDKDHIVQWLPPDEMRGQAHIFDPHVDGEFCITLTYTTQSDSQSGKTSENSDTFQGYFIELIPYEKIVQTVEFEADDPVFAGNMTITTTFTDIDGGTEVVVLCEGIPRGIRPQDNAAGWTSSLNKLAALVETQEN